MQPAVQPILEDHEAARCPRCLQPVPAKASRCPACRQPIHSQRFLPFVIGVAGLLVLVFAMLVMYQVVRNEDAAREPVPVEDDAARQQDLFPNPPPANSTSSQPSKPEKHPPLNEH